MRRVLQFLHPARDLRCDFRVILDTAALFPSVRGKVTRDSSYVGVSVCGNSCCMLRNLCNSGMLIARRNDQETGVFALLSLEPETTGGHEKG